jgi:hypothetical protein
MASHGGYSLDPLAAATANLKVSPKDPVEVPTAPSVTL